MFFFVFLQKNNEILQTNSFGYIPEETVLETVPEGPLNMGRGGVGETTFFKQLSSAHDVVDELH